jgi:hypothetical protein
LRDKPVFDTLSQSAALLTHKRPYGRLTSLFFNVISELQQYFKKLTLQHVKINHSIINHSLSTSELQTIKPQADPTATDMSETTKLDTLGHYASVNGLKMYYEIHGTGTPWC